MLNVNLSKLSLPVQYSTNNRFHFQGNVIKVNHILKSTCNVLAPNCLTKAHSVDSATEFSSKEHENLVEQFLMQPPMLKEC
jgi:hypothetical protein